MHVVDDDSLKRGLIDSKGRMQNTIFINESGLYALVLSSNLPCCGRTIQTPIPWGGVGGGFLGWFFRYT